MKKRKFLLGLLAVSAIFGLASCAKEFTVSFETDGGSTVEAVIVTKNDALAIPETPTKGGYTFEGWYFDEALTQPVDFSSFVVEGNVTLYAKWSLNSYTVNFDTMGGSEVASQVVKHGESVQLPVAPTKEGYQFVGWYSKNDYSEVYANDAIKANTTLYAKWRSALRYAGTFEGEGKYNAEDGTYTFTIQLELWGRVRIVYNNQVLSMDDEELLVSGAFTNNNQAPWTTELYCDIPDETSQEVDWTTLINSCNNPVKYVITYDPAGHTLDIQAEEILPAKPEIPTEGFYYEVYDNYKAFVTGGTIAADENGDYKFDATLGQWHRVIMYYNGEKISIADAELVKSGDFGSYNPADKDLYIDVENDGEYPLLCDFASEGGTPYSITYNHTNKTLDIQDDEVDAVVVIPEEGFCYEYTAPDTTLMAPTVVEKDEATGSYILTIELNAWRYVVMYFDGQVIDSADENLDCTLSGAVYIDDLGAPTSRFYVNANGKYQFVYTPATETENAKLVAGNYVETQPDDDVDGHVFTIASDEYAKVFTEGTVDTVSLWRLYIIVDAEGKIAYMCEMPRNGYGSIASDTYVRHSDYADYTNNPAYVDGAFVVPQGGFALEAYQGNDNVKSLMEAITGITYAEHAINTNSINVNNIRVAYNSEAGTITVTTVEAEIPSDGLYFEYTEGAQPALTSLQKAEHDEATGTYKVVVELGAWRYVQVYYNGVLVDTADENLEHSLSDGFYLDDLGAPTSRLYVNKAGKYQIVYTPATEEAKASLVAGKYVENVQPELPDENDGHTFTVASDEYAVVFTEGTVDTISKWRLYIIVDAEGKIAYMCEMPRNGYGSIASDTYVRHSDYADHTTNPAYVDGAFVVPQGGFAFELYQGNEHVQALMTAITGVPYAEHAINTNTINVDNVRVAYDAANVTISVSKVEEEAPVELVVTYGGTLQGNATLNAATGNYEMVLELKTWNNVIIYLNGEAVSIDTLTTSGLICKAAGADWTENLYWEAEDLTKLYTCTGGKYVLKYNPTVATLDISLYSVTYGGTLQGSAKLDEATGNYEMILELNTWNNVIIYLNGEAVSIDTLTTSGLICKAAGADWTENLYWEAEDLTKLYTCTGGKYLLKYNPTAATLDISLYVEPTGEHVFTIASDEYAVVFTEGTVDTISKWRLYIIVDAEGKIAYMCEMPRNGYGSITSDTYVRHSDYADHTTNPAYVDGAFVVPQGGFALEAYQGNANVQALMTVITGVSYAEHAINTNTINVDNVRVVYDAAAGTITVTK